MKSDEVKSLVERGVRELNEALAAGKSDRLQKFLDVMSRFPKYSFNNCILIALQSPDASMVQGFHAWKKIGRTVIKGQKGIGIMAPMIGRKKEDEAKRATDEKSVFGFKVVHVFDISQTEGEPLPEIAQANGDPGIYTEAMEAFVSSSKIELVYEVLPGGADGLSQKGKIIINPDLAPARRMTTLVHEMAHELLHGDIERRKLTTTTIRETEAEAVAAVVAQSLGLDSMAQSADYIQLYSGDTNVLTKSLDAVQKTAAQIIEGIHAHVVGAEQLAA